MNNVSDFLSSPPGYLLGLNYTDTALAAVTGLCSGDLEVTSPSDCPLHLTRLSPSIPPSISLSSLGSMQREMLCCAWVRR